MNGLNISLDNLALQSVPGKLSRVRTQRSRAHLDTDDASAELESIADGIVRVTWRSNASWENEPTSHAAAPGRRRRPSWRYTRSHRRLTAGSACVRFAPRPLTLSFGDESGLFLREATGPSRGYADSGVALAWTIARSERVYGLGQNSFATLNRVGQLRSMAADHTGHSGGDIPIPFWVSSRGYGVLVDNPNIGYFDLTKPGRVVFRAQDGYASYFVLWGPTMFDVLRRYAELTGRAPMPPRWFLGPMFSRIPGGRKPGYRSDRELVALGREFRKREIPADCLILDYQWDEWIGAYRWNRKKFGRARWMLRGLDRLGFKAILQLKPAVNVAAGTVAELDRKGLALKRIDGTLHTGNYHQGRSIFLDVFQSETREWLWTRLRRLLADGVAGWWTDEGDWLGYSHQTTRDLRRSRGALRNLYNNAWCQAIFDGQRRETDRRVVNITRSGWAGIQRFGTTVWTGDVSTTWKGLEAQMQMGLNMAMSGVPFWTTDGGGFLEKDPTAELYIRWAQFAVFCPITRFHGCGPREPWHYGGRAERIVREMLRWRMRLMPYIYSAAHRACTHGHPMIRPMALEYPNDRRFANCTSQYLFGPSLLVRPVTEPAASIRRAGGRVCVMTGRGCWYDFWSGAVLPRRYDHSLELDLERPPVLVRGPAILVLSEPDHHTGPQDGRALTIRLYLGPMHTAWQADAELIEDDGTTYRYETGRRRITRILARRTGANRLRLTLTPAGRFPGRPKHRRWTLEVFGTEKTPLVEFGGTTLRATRGGSMWTTDIQQPNADEAASIDIRLCSAGRLRAGPGPRWGG